MVELFAELDLLEFDARSNPLGQHGRLMASVIGKVNSIVSISRELIARV